MLEQYDYIALVHYGCTGYQNSIYRPTGFVYVMYEVGCLTSRTTMCVFPFATVDAAMSLKINIVEGVVIAIMQ
jgi:hypothetical protein